MSSLAEILAEIHIAICKTIGETSIVRHLSYYYVSYDNLVNFFKFGVCAPLVDVECEVET